jgi:hypothetical protein
MKKILGLAALACILSACGPKSLTLPEDPVDRAATCGIVAAAEAREATADVQAPLPFEAQGRILHYALLAASADGAFSPEQASAVSKRMSELQEGVTSGKWQELAPACHAAFPEAEAGEVKLPDDRLMAQLGCDELEGFLSTALASQKARYGNELGEYRQLANRLNQVMGPALTARAGAGLGAQRELRREALAEIARAGSPMAVMEQCIARFAG